MIIEAFNPETSHYIPAIEGYDYFSRRHRRVSLGAVRFPKPGMLPGRRLAKRIFGLAGNQVPADGQAYADPGNNPPAQAGQNIPDPATGGNPNPAQPSEDTPSQDAQEDSTSSENTYDSFDEKKTDTPEPDKGAKKGEQGWKNPGMWFGITCVVLTGVLAISIAVMVDKAEKKIRMDLRPLKQF